MTPLRDDLPLLQGQARVLDLVASGAPLVDALLALIDLIETSEAGARCNILRMPGAGGRLARGIGPSLPDGLHEALEGLVITPPYLGACGKALHTGQAVSVPDVAAANEFPAAWRDLLLSHGLRAVRSTPVRGTDGRVLATLALYYPTPRDPRPTSPDLIALATHLAAIALERDDEREAVKAREARLGAMAGQFAGLVQNAPFGTYVIDADFVVRHASRIAFKAFRMPALIGTDLAVALRTIWPDPFASEVIARFRHTLATGEPYVSTDTVEKRADLDTVEAYDWRTERIVMADGRFGVVCYFYDLTERLQMEAALRESDARLRLFIERAPAAIAMFDTRMRYVSASRRYLLDYLAAPGDDIDPARLVGRSHYDVFPDLPQRWRAIHARVLAGETLSADDDAFPRADGRVDWVRWEMTPWRHEDGSIGGALLFSEVVTGRHETERRQAFLLRLTDALRAAPREAMSAVVKQVGAHLGVSRVGYGEVDATGTFVDIAREYADGSVAAAIGRHRLGDFGPAIVAELRAGRTLVVDDVLADPRTRDSAVAHHAIGTRSIVTVPLLQDGRLRATLYLNHKEPRAWGAEHVALVEEVAARSWAVIEQARAEDALERTAADFRDLADNISQFAWMMQPDGWIFWYNRRWFDYTGTALEQMQGWGWRAVHHPDHVDRVVDRFRAAILAGEPWEDTFPLRGADGGYRWFLSRARPIRDASGRILRWFGTNTDVTEQREAEAALVRSAREFEALVAVAAQIVWKTDATGKVVEDSPSWRAFTGQTLAEWQGAGWFEAFHPDDRETVARVWQEAVAGRDTVTTDYRLRHVSGEYRWTTARAAPILDEDGSLAGYIGMNTDISERKAAEAALRHSESQFRTTADVLPGMLFVTSSEGRNTYVNSGFCAYTGKPTEALLEDHWLDVIHPEDVPRGWEIWREAVRDERLYVAEYRFRRHDGAWRWHMVRAMPSRGVEGRVQLWVGVCIDIHDRRTLEDDLRRLNDGLEARVRDAVAEREAAQARLAHAQRMEALGQLAGGIAHDFNNITQAVQGGAGLIRRRAADPQAVDHLARMVEDAARRGTAVTRRLLAFARRGELQAEPVDVAALLADMHEVLAHTMTAAIEVRTEVQASPLPPLRADKAQLETVLVNLAANGRDAMPRGGTLTLSAAEETVRSGTRHPSGLLPGAYIRLSVTDTGEGMSAEVLARASEPFFTTKPRGAGTGLGLAMARGFAEQSGGALALHSEAGAGTTVNLWLPVAHSPASPEPAPDGSANAGRPSACVLVVDDEALVREVLADSLREHGFEVLRACDGRTALATLDAGAAVDLLLTDYAMPGLDGVSLIEQARARRPGLPAILLTGNAGRQVDAKLALDGVVSGAFSLMRKPVAADQLADRIEGLLRPSHDLATLAGG